MKKIFLFLLAMIVLSGCDVDANRAYNSCAQNCKENQAHMGETYTMGCLQNCSDILAAHYSCK